MQDRIELLVHDLAERYISQTGPLQYDGEELLAEEVVDLMLPSLLAYTRALLLDLELISDIDDFPYSFTIVDEPGMSPIQAKRHGQGKLPFSTLANELIEIFEVDLVAHRHDLVPFMQAAGRLIGVRLAPPDR
jgi:hypothetical protein